MAPRWWLLLPALSACADFPDPSTVVDLRVLAMTVDPPEIIEDGTGVLPELTATPLIVDPDGEGRPVTWTVRACANDPAAPTAPGAGTEGASNYPAGGARSSVGSARCPPDGPTSWTVIGEDQARPAGASVTFRFTAGQLAAALAADVFPGFLGGAHGGFDLGLPITLDLLVRAGEQEAAAVKRVVFWPRPLRDGQRPNRNPVVGEVRSYADRDPGSLEPVGPVVTLATDQTTAMIAGQSLWLEPAGAEAEPYVTTIVDRLTDETHVHEVPAETLRYTFYATAGKFSLFETASELPAGATSPGRVHVESRYTAPRAEDLPVDAPSGLRQRAVTVWIVVRDERGGVSWIERQLRVAE
jgi:hypothetical protein